MGPLKYAKHDSPYEQKVRRVEEVLREEGITLLDGNIIFDDGKIYRAQDYELGCGSSPDDVALPRDDEATVLVLQEFIEE